MIEKEKEKEFAYQQFMKEKLMIDEVVRKIYEEDAKVRQIEMEKKMEQRAYIEQFQMEQQHWQAVEKARIEAEAQNIKQYATQQEKRATERQIKRKEANQALEQVPISFICSIKSMKSNCVLNFSCRPKQVSPPSWMRRRSRRMSTIESFKTSSLPSRMRRSAPRRRPSLRRSYA